jgi:hypothetical protein
LIYAKLQFIFFFFLQYYTDPESGIVFRSIKEVERYLQTGEVAKQASVPRRSITDIYSFEGSAEMVIN